MCLLREVNEKGEWIESIPPFLKQWNRDIGVFSLYGRPRDLSDPIVMQIYLYQQ